MLLRLSLRLSALCLLAVVSAFAQCTYTLTGVSTFDSNTTNSVLSVTPSASTCAWTSKSNVTWITISFGQAGTGNGTVGFTVSPNTTSSARTGTITVGTANFTVTQSGATCSYSLSPTSGSQPSTGGNGTFNVTSNCTWTPVSSSTDWLTVTTQTTTGNGTVQYQATANLTAVARSATIAIGPQLFTVNQAGPCTFTLNPFTIQADPTNGATGTFTVTASATSCAWTASTANADFVAVTSGTSGTGNGTVGYSVQPNRTTSPRSGSIAVGSASFGIYQNAGTACSYTLSTSSATYAASGGNGSFSVTSACPWTATVSVPWITIGNATSTTGTGTINYAVTPNSAAVPRSGVIQIGTQTFAISQAGVPCTVNLSQNLFQIPAAGQTFSIDVAAADGCTWNAATPAPWITVTPATGTGPGSILVTAAANSTASPRSAALTVANQVATINEDAAVCNQQLNPAQASLPAAAGTFAFTVSTACSYTAVSSANWIKIVGGATANGTADVTYSVTANTTPDARSGVIAVGPQNFTVSQSGAGCSLTLSPTSADIGPSGGSGAFDVAATGNCRWQPKADVGWIRFTFTSVNGTGRVNYTADPTDQTTPRTGNLAIADQNFQLRQAARSALQISQNGVLNGASFAAGPVAPGEIVAIFGTAIGPDPGLTLQLSPDNSTLTNSLGSTRVLFDGTPAPLIYASSGQVSAIVPYSVAGKTTTKLQLEYRGTQSAPLTLSVAATSPALFTLDASGSGQGAILNQNASVNGPTNPATKNSTIVLYATGDGQTTPAGVDGKLATNPLPKPVAPVAVTIGGIAARVSYAGAAPGLPAGVLQVNVVVPPNAPSGAVPVILQIGPATSPSAVTVMIQ